MIPLPKKTKNDIKRIRNNTELRMTRSVQPSKQPDVSYFTVQYSSDALNIAPNLPWDFQFSFPAQYGVYEKGTKTSTIRLVNWNIVRNPSYAGVYLPFFLDSDMSSKWISNFIAYLTTDSGGGDINTTIIPFTYASDVIQLKLFYDSKKKITPTPADEIIDAIFRFQVINYY